MYPNQGPGMAPPPTAECVSKVELRLECRNLLNRDVMSKSDPCAVLYMSCKGGHWDEVCIFVQMISCYHFTSSF